MHFSRLPKYRGVYTSTWPIMNGETESGVTLHLIDAGIDAGPIVAQRCFALPPGVTARRLHEMYMDEAFELFKDNFLRLIYGDYQLIEQDHDEATYYPRNSTYFAERAKIDLCQPASLIERTVRAFCFPEYQLASFDGRPIRACHIIRGKSSQQYGTVLCRTSLGAMCVAGDGKLVELVWGQSW